MQIAKKQLLGFGGLALVVGLTAFATTLPADAISTGGNVQVQVQVYGTNTDTVINSPLDGDVYNQPEITFSETHSHAYGVTYTLEKLNSDGSVAKSWDLGHAVTGEDVNGNTEFAINLDDYDGTGVYVIRSVAGTKYGSTKEDEVRFTYAAISADQDDVSTSGTVTSFRVYYTAGVKSLTYQLKNSNGETISGVYKVDTASPATGGYADLSIDFADLNLETGTYTIYIVGYEETNAEGDVIGTAAVTFKYTKSAPVGPDEPDAPNVPDTGSLLSALNISRADFLITGLIAFVAISVAALFVIKKAHKKQ